MITEYKDMLKSLVGDLPGCGDGFIINKIAETVRDICERTEGYTKTVSGVVDSDNCVKIKLKMEASTKRVTRVYIVNDDGSKTDYTSYDFNGDDIVEIPDSDIGETVFIDCAVLPYFDACGFDPVFMNEFFSVIKAGVFYSLMRQSRKPWTNPQLAEEYKKQYARGIGSVNKEKLFKNKTGKLKLNIPGVF